MALAKILSSLLFDWLIKIFIKNIESDMVPRVHEPGFTFFVRELVDCIHDLVV